MPKICTRVKTSWAKSHITSILSFLSAFSLGYFGGNSDQEGNYRRDFVVSVGVGLVIGRTIRFHCNCD